MKAAIVRLPASATSALPRWILLVICAVYIASGLFGRDPWKNEDAAGFGIMWTMANGDWRDWLLPNLVGKYITASGPLIYWLGAASIRALSPWVTPSDASRVITGLLFYLTCLFVWYSSYLLGRRKEVQPFKYAFGGEPSPRDYGRTLADGALLILLGCFGLAERGHETTPEIAQFACIAIMLYGLIRGLDKPRQGAIWWGAALGFLSLAAHPALLIALLLGTLALVFMTQEIRLWPLFAIGMPVCITIAAAWPLTAAMILTGSAHEHLYHWAVDNFLEFSGPLINPLFYTLKNLPLFTWPAWPLAAWAWYSWAGFRRAPHMMIPLSMIAPLLIMIVLQTHQTNRLFVLLLPALSMLATFALPTLKRGAINAMDWFALLSFTILSVFVWIFWLAAQTGFPAWTARNFMRLLPGFQSEFNLWMFIFALLSTVCWMMLVRWRLARSPKVLWRSVVLSSSGTTLLWVLLMTLWLPFINYSRTYRDVATQLARQLPTIYQCIWPIGLGEAQIASFAYFGNMHFSFSDENCDVLLIQDTPNNTETAVRSSASDTWKLVWEGRRPADRDERFRLYVRDKLLPQHKLRTSCQNQPLADCVTSSPA